MKRTYYTKEHILTIAKLWEQKTVKEIADELGLEPKNVIYLALMIRRAGYKLARKRKNGSRLSFIKDCLGIK
jgi:hypothetical protein